ncbi:MAG: Glycine--tRNA ligase beta subunit [Spirochaetes bacterium ADurb.Bin218]|jgi:glycyl-tRNA synthetase beta chain|nr:MAG: Glycine--tRNA ligase beta subunit [Spirochaetes bacterium ADurb.Bin218]
MIKDANFLCEIGTEEIPAGYIPPAINGIESLFKEKLVAARIDFDEIEVYATPRRFTIMISGLKETQRSETVELKGPSKQAAFDKDGNPTKALEGFLKANGVSLADVELLETEKGSYVFAKRTLASGKTEDIIPQIIESLVYNLPFPKRMRWADKTVTFPRPISYFLVLFNDKVVPFEIEGIKSGNLTRGHFVQFNRMIEINKISEYVNKLRENWVIIDHRERKEIIRQELLKAAEAAGGFLLEDEDLLNTVTFLVEKPHIIVCEFDQKFLEVPDIVLIAEMKEHQKYFAVIDKEGRLINKFLVTANNPETPNIIKGNVKVISARFNDAEFFYREDAKVKLEDRLESLKRVLFHKELGSIYDKVMRVKSISEALVSLLSIDNETARKIMRAVMLSKTDLDTAMVYEFASLQGYIGRIYALNEGEDKEVAEAINDQYKPRFSGDSIPTAMVSIVVSLSEKIDNIFGSFSVGNIPKGSQDPYALRRQANAIVDIIIRNGLKFQLVDVLKAVSSNYRDGFSLIGKLIDFVNGRARTIFTEAGFRYDEIDACMLEGNSDYLELYKRAESLNVYRKNEKFGQLLLGFKRMNNILSAFRKENKDYKLSFSESLLEEKEERDLYFFFAERRKQMEDFISHSKYIELFELMTEAKPLIDSFFDKVLVMDKRIEIRDNRLFILESVLNIFNNLIDFSKISE